MSKLNLPQFGSITGWILSYLEFQHLQQATSYMDASSVYGSTLKDQLALRQKESGKDSGNRSGMNTKSKITCK